MRKITSLLMVIVLCLLTAPAWSATLYDNGLLNGNINAYTLGFGFSISNSFDLSSNSNLTGVQIGLWSGSIQWGISAPVSVDWSIGTTPFDNTYGSGTASLSNTYYGVNSAYQAIWESTFPLSMSLTAGMYWLTLTNGVGSPINGYNGMLSWDVTNGSSQAQQSVIGSIGSESFQIYGTAVPEPTTMLLLGSALLGLVGLRRKF